MIPDDCSKRAFTLVELLVVVAIMALLLALLAPMLARANEIARRVQCATNLKDVGTAVHIFAGAHMGRAPSHAVRIAGEQYVGFFGQLADYGVMQNKVSKSYYQSGYMACPSFARSDKYSFYWFQSFVISGDVASNHPHPHVMNGQPYTDNGVTQAGAYGRLIEPAPPGYIFYALGQVIQDFTRPGWKFMLWECHNSAGDEIFGPRYGMPEAVPLYPPGDAYPPWVSNPYGTYSFRHVLPPNPAQYQTQATGNFLFIDAHVESLTPMDHINRVDRFRLRE